MDRKDLQAYIEETYGVGGEYLFAKYPEFQVFRHSNSRKWFVVIMEVPKEKLGLSGGKDSAAKRQAMLKRLNLPERMSSNAMLQALNVLYSKEELVKLLEE